MRQITAVIFLLILNTAQAAEPLTATPETLVDYLLTPELRERQADVVREQLARLQVELRQARRLRARDERESRLELLQRQADDLEQLLLLGATFRLPRLPDGGLDAGRVGVLADAVGSPLYVVPVIQLVDGGALIEIGNSLACLETIAPTQLVDGRLSVDGICYRVGDYRSYRNLLGETRTVPSLTIYDTAPARREAMRRLNPTHEFAAPISGSAWLLQIVDGAAVLRINGETQRVALDQLQPADREWVAEQWATMRKRRR